MAKIVAGWLGGVEARLKRGNAVLFAKDCVLFAELNQAIRRTSHKAMVLWAWEFAAEAVATLEGRHAGEPRPRIALDASRAWAAGEV
ncbi:MAG: hypothetical protein LBL01_03000 [Bifidobacteriaceae bacterium]|nr:hypothetical protein [Bifidobacteriaceae bacterium]